MKVDIANPNFGKHKAEELFIEMVEITTLEERKKKANENVNKVVVAVLDYLNMKSFMIRAYTPGFNDGEPCEHTQETFLDTEEMKYFDFDDENYNDDLSKKAFENAINKTADNKEKLHIAYKLIEAIENDLRLLHGTDWQILFTSDGTGGVTTEMESYNCGY